MYFSILFIVLNSILIIEIVAQDYTPINFSEGVWIEEFSGVGGEFCNSQKYCSGDSIVDEVNYHKLFEYKIFSESPGLDTKTEGPSLIGLITNFIDKKVLYIPYGSTIPDTIYDFNIELGDSIECSLGGFVIREIDSVEVCGVYHKRFSEFEGSSNFENTLIEGVGFSTGLLGYYDHFDYGHEQLKFIDCFFETMNQNCPNCQLIYTSNEQRSWLKTYPNPFTQNIIIHSDMPISTITITDLNGKQVFMGKFTNQTYIELNLDFLKSGLYNLKLHHENKSSHNSQIIKI